MCPGRFLENLVSIRVLSSTPHWIRTSNLRFRRPMLYPVELGVQSLCFAGSIDSFGVLRETALTTVLTTGPTNLP